MTSELLKNYDACEDTLKKLYDSRLRIAILDALDKGPMRLADLRRVVDSNAPNTSAKAKELEDMGILERADGDFRLTDWGSVLAMCLRDNMDAMSRLSKVKEYWATHEMGTLPIELQKRLVLVKGLDMRDYGFDVNKSEDDFCKMLRSITGPRFYGLSGIFSRVWVGITAELAQKGVDIKLILTEGVLRSVAETLDTKEKIREWESAPNIELFAIDFSPDFAFTACSQFFATRNKDKATGSQDLYKAVYSTSQEAIDLGLEIFNFYRTKAKPVKLRDYL